MSDKRKSNKERSRRKDENRDPISGAPGAHPVGTGVGAAAGGAAGIAGAAAVGAAAGSVVGPAGTIAGAAVGAVVGGLAGKGIAEKVNPTVEDAYWREQYSREPYFDPDYSYDEFQGAYRLGYEGYQRYGDQGKSYDEIEPELRSDYERTHANSRLKWDRARNAARAAWARFERERKSERLAAEHDQNVSGGGVQSGAAGEDRQTPAEEMREREEVARSRRRHE